MKSLLSRSWLPRSLAAVGGGVAWASCFGREGLLLLPWVAQVPLIWLTGAPRGWAWVWLHGFVSWSVAAVWLVPTLVSFGNLPHLISWPLLALMALYLGSYQAAFAVLGRSLWRRGGWLALLGLPALWVVIEWLRGWLLFGGFSWNMAGYAWVEVPGALPLSAWVGTYGVSFLLLFANVGLTLAWWHRRWNIAAIAILVPLSILPMAGRWSQPDPAEFSTTGRQVHVLQPNLPIVFDEGELQRNYNQLLAMSRAECRAREATQRLLIWPESAAWPFAYERSAKLQRDIDELVANGCDVIANSPSWLGDEPFNSALLISRNGPQAVYHKRHLVPWGEYVPLGEVLPFVGKLARQAGAFTPGEDVALLPWQGEEIGMAICYEITYPAAVAEQVRAGATFLATITNDAWYGDTTAPWQHFRAARFRAAENRRPLLRAALTGVSGIIDARGAVEQSLGVGERGVLRARVAGHHGLSPYSRWPWLVPGLSFLLAAFAIVLSRWN